MKSSEICVPAEEISNIFNHLNWHHQLKQLSIEAVYTILFSTSIAFLFALVLWRTKQLHRNSRLLLASLPIALLLFLVVDLLKILAFQQINTRLQLTTGKLGPDQCVLLNASFYHFAILTPRYFAIRLVHNLPILMVVEKLFSTLFYRSYEKNKSYVWVVVILYLIEILLETLLMVTNVAPISSLSLTSLSTHTSMAYFQTVLCTHLLVIFCSLFLYKYNQKVYLNLNNQCHKGSSLVSVRYQLRENLRSLKHILWITISLMILSIFAATSSLRIRIWQFPKVAEPNQQVEHRTYDSVALDLLKTMASEGLSYELISLAFFCIVTMISHQNVRSILWSTILNRLRSLKQVCFSNKRKSLCNSTSSTGAYKLRTNRVSVLFSISEAHQLAHFESLEKYWDQNGPLNLNPIRLMVASHKCSQSAPCSTVTVENYPI